MIGSGGKEVEEDVAGIVVEVEDVVVEELEMGTRESSSEETF